MLSVDLIKILSNKEKYKLNKCGLLYLDLPAFYGQYGCKRSVPYMYLFIL